jgi:leucyl aminopeptidase
LTSFHTRYYQTSSGLAASQWVQSRIEGYAESASKGWNISVRPFTHSWKQNSVIVRLEDRNATTSENEAAVVILGAHLDSVNWLNPWFGRSPGADDDGSGIISQSYC